VSDESTASILKTEEGESGEKGFTEDGNSRFWKIISKYPPDCIVSHP
jgi:hypothetical protein